MKQSYSDLKKRLDEIIFWFEQDEIDLDEALIKYQEAQKLIEQIEAYLSALEQKINVK